MTQEKKDTANIILVYKTTLQSINVKLQIRKCPHNLQNDQRSICFGLIIKKTSSLTLND